MDRQFCQRQMDEGINKDIWSWCRIFLRVLGSRISTRWRPSVTCLWMMSKQMCVSVSPWHEITHYFVNFQQLTWCVQYRFDHEMKEVVHGDLTLEMMKVPQGTWIETFLGGVTDKLTGLPIFKELVWFPYKVSGVMYSPCRLVLCTRCFTCSR